MGAGQERILRRRIKGVESTKKITRAMELIAASQIVRAQSRIAGSRPYQEAVAKAVAEVAGEVGAKGARLLGTPTSLQSVAIVAVVADRGLCGGYNSSVLRTVERKFKAYQSEGVEIHLFTVGKKAQSYFRYREISVETNFVGMTDKPKFSDAEKISDALVHRFQSGEFDLVEIVSTRFISAGTQKVEIAQLLPLPESVKGETQSGYRAMPELEPEAVPLLAALLPQYLETSIFGALLEASASEHTARQRAMSSATENAEELITDYTREMNRVRQEAITTEIMEIVGGAEALRQAAATERN